MGDHLTRYSIKIGLIVLAMALVVAWRLLAPKVQASPRLGRALTAALAVLALASTVAYFEFGWLRYDRYMNPHDVYHYYVGAKYSPEHRYFDLYRASLVADSELGSRYTAKDIRNLEVTTRYERVGAVMKDKEKIKASFTPMRWVSFKDDIAYFRSLVPKWKWNRMLRDKGYNATPVWNAIARALTEMTPTSSLWGMRALTYIDLGFLLAMFAAIAWAFGPRVMLMSVVFLGTLFIMSHAHIKGAFMRLDWVACLVVAVCCMKKERFAVAGGLVAYAGLARVFPFVFCFGPGVKLLFELVDWARAKRSGAPRPLHRGYIAFFGAFTGVLALLVGMTLLPQGGAELWRDFFAKIAMHDRDLSTTRVGFKYLFMLPWEGFRAKAAGLDQYKPLFYALCLLALGATALAVRRAKDYELLPLSYVAAFFLLAPTFYYHVMLLVPLFAFLPRASESWARAIGLLLMFALSLVGYGLSWSMEHSADFWAVHSWALLVLSAYLVASGLWGDRLGAPSRKAVVVA